MAVRSRRIYGPAAVPSGGGYHTLYTVPAGRTLVIRSLAIVNRSGGGDTGGWYVTGSGADGFFLLPRVLDNGQSFELVDCWFALNPGDTLSGYAGSRSLQFYVSGSLLMGAPS